MPGAASSGYAAARHLPRLLITSCHGRAAAPLTRPTYGKVNRWTVGALMLVPLLAGCVGSGTNVAGVSPVATLSGAVVPSALTEPPTVTPPPPDRPFSLVLNNADGAIVALYLNGQYIGAAACALDPAASPIPPLSPGASLPTPFAPAGSLPPLPWRVIVVSGPGIIIGQYDEDGRAGPRAIIVRGTTTVETAAPGDPGPAAVGPCATLGTIPALALQNGTTLELTLVVNGTTVRTLGPARVPVAAAPTVFSQASSVRCRGRSRPDLPAAGCCSR